MNMIPVRINLFGIGLSTLLPNYRISVFILGVVFWMVAGPWVKWVLKKAILLVQDDMEEKTWQLRNKFQKHTAIQPLR